MASTRKLIHSLILFSIYLISYFPIFKTGIYQLNRLLIIINRNNNQILNKGFSLLDGFSYLQFSIRRIEKIIDIFHVYLHKRNAYTPILFILCMLKVIEDIIQREWNHALILSFYSLQCSHRVGFACTCLTIYEKTGIISIQHVGYDGKA